MATKNNPGVYDCWKNAEPDEPMFILLGRDKHAPALVWLWAAMRELDGEDPAKVREAQQVMVDMLDWANAKGKRPAGISTGILCGILELIKVVNQAVDTLDEKSKTEPTSPDFWRRVLAKTEFREIDNAPDNQ